MWFTFLRMTPGWFTDTRSLRGLSGTHILEFGLAGHISRSESASESVGSAVLDGGGRIGDSIGITDTPFTVAQDTTR